VPLNSNINLSALVVSTQDINLEDNLVNLADFVVGSFDPNDKTVDPVNITPEMREKGKRLVYNIRFQNTGTLATTFVIISDTLTAELDLNSVQFIASSHPCTWRIVSERVIEFSFLSLSLPPAQDNEIGSHGFVQFSIATSKTLEINESVRNKASIFFDYNEPIITNYAESTVRISNTDSSDDLKFNLMPNPVQNEIFIEWQQSIQGKIKAQLFNEIGQICGEISLIQSANRQLVFNVKSLPVGVYTMMILNEKGNSGSAKVVVIR
jgi:hypothetical protein